jgi:hypothetical protein
LTPPSYESQCRRAAIGFAAFLASEKAVASSRVDDPRGCEFDLGFPLNFAAEDPAFVRFLCRASGGPFVHSNPRLVGRFYQNRFEAGSIGVISGLIFREALLSKLLIRPPH